MRLNSQDLNGAVPLISSEIAKHFKIQVQTLQFYIQNNQIFFDGEMIFKGMKVKVFGKSLIGYNNGFVVLQLSDAFIRNQLLNIDLMQFLNEYVKNDSEIKVNQNQIYLPIDLLPFKIQINQLNIQNQEINIEAVLG